MKLSNIVRNERPLAVEVETVDGDGVINIVYKPSVITPASAAASRDENPEKLFMVVVLAQLLILLSKWDLEDDGQIIPITEDGLSGVPTLILVTIWEAIGEDIREKKVKKASNSQGSFGPAA